MRLWSIHPKYLDTSGLLGLWREGLLAKKVLEGKTKGYTHHPQLLRFKAFHNPTLAINAYLSYVLSEGKRRNYNLNENKINFITLERLLPVTSGQVEFEFSHLLNKLKKRSQKFYEQIKEIQKIEINPIFYLVEGHIEAFEMTHKFIQKKSI